MKLNMDMGTSLCDTSQDINLVLQCCVYIHNIVIWKYIHVYICTHCGMIIAASGSHTYIQILKGNTAKVREKE